MKKLLLLGVASLSVFTGFSQIVIEAVDFPQAGDSIYQGIDTLIPLTITPGSPGANQSWISHSYAPDKVIPFILQIQQHYQAEAASLIHFLR